MNIEGTLVNLSNDFRNYAGCSSLVSCIDEVKGIVDTYPKDQIQYVAYGALKGMAVGGGAVYGTTLFAATMNVFIEPTVTAGSMKVGLLATIMNIGTYVIRGNFYVGAGALILGAGIGGIKNGYDTYNFNAKAELSCRMEDVLQRSLNFIKAREEGVSVEQEARFIEDITTNHDVWNWNIESFQLNNAKFDEYNWLKPGLGNRIKLVFLCALTKIQEANRSLVSLRESFEHLMYHTTHNEENRELISFARYHLGKLYLESADVEGAINQYRQVLDESYGTRDTGLHNAVQNDLNRLI